MFRIDIYFTDGNCRKIPEVLWHRFEDDFIVLAQTNGDSTFINRHLVQMLCRTKVLSLSEEASQ
jgi:hypothetical protein